MKAVEALPWMLRPVYFVLRFFIAAFFIFYVMFGVFSTIHWAKGELNKRQDVSRLADVISRHVQEGTPEEVVDWVRFRPLNETSEIINIITPESAVLDFRLFFELATRQLRLGNTEDSLFWTQLGRYRLRYDLERCGVPDSLEWFGKFLVLSESPAIKDLLAQRPELVKKSVKQVLDFDKKYPAHNNPQTLCTSLQKLSKDKEVLTVPMSEWEKVRHHLQRNTEKFLNNPGQK